MKNCEDLQNPKMGNDSELLRISMKKNNLEELKETTIRKNQIAISIGGRGHQKRTLGWRTKSVI